jgi:hypothetical protein
MAEVFFRRRYGRLQGLFPNHKKMQVLDETVFQLLYGEYKPARQLFRNKKPQCATPQTPNKLENRSKVARIPASL